MERIRNLTIRAQLHPPGREAATAKWRCWLSVDPCGTRLAPEPPLLPRDPFDAVKAMELACHIKLDIELVARRCLPELLFNKPVSDETKGQVKDDLAKGIKAVSRLAVCDPYAAGNEFTIADLYAFYGFGLARMMAENVVGVDLLAEEPKLAALIERLADRPSIAIFANVLEEFLSSRGLLGR